MAGFRSLDGIHRERADRIGEISVSHGQCRL
jgi:hypothetical protein